MRKERQGEGFKTTLKYYGKEHSEYPTEYELKVSDKTAELIVSKLKRHFKIKASLRFFGSRQSGLCSCSLVSRVRLSHNPSVGLICHELGHAFLWQKERKRGHNKRHARAFRKLIDFSRKKNYWLSSQETAEFCDKIRDEPTVYQKKEILEPRFTVQILMGLPQEVSENIGRNKLSDTWFSFVHGHYCLPAICREPREIEVFPIKINEVLTCKT